MMDWKTALGVSAFTFMVMFIIGANGCNDPRAKAILADQQIRAEVCSFVFPNGIEGKPVITYSANDTPGTKAEIKMALRYFTVYCG